MPLSRFRELEMRVATLDRLPQGSRGEVVAVSDDRGYGTRLRRVGVREGAIVELLAGRDPAILRLEGACIAVARELLAAVTICRCGCEKEDERSQAEGRTRGVDA